MSGEGNGIIPPTTLGTYLLPVIFDKNTGPPITLGTYLLISPLSPLARDYGVFPIGGIASTIDFTVG